MRCFLEKVTQLENFLHDRRSRQISSLGPHDTKLVLVMHIIVIFRDESVLFIAPTPASRMLSQI